MSLEDKLKELDSLQRIEIEMQIEKAIEENLERRLQSELVNIFRLEDRMLAERLIKLLDKRYERKKP